MLGRRLDRRDILRCGEQREFLGCRNMQHMDAPAGLARQRQDALRRQRRRLDIAQVRMLPGAGSRVEQRIARVQPVFVLGMDGGAPVAAGQDTAQGLVVGNQQRSGRAAHEDLDTGTARQPFQRAQFLSIGISRAEEEGIVAPGPPFGPAQFVGQRRFRIRIR